MVRSYACHDYLSHPGVQIQALVEHVVFLNLIAINNMT